LPSLYFTDELEHAICLYQVNYSSASISKLNYWCLQCCPMPAFVARDPVLLFYSWTLTRFITLWTSLVCATMNTRH
jgi:hypothetical protein